MLAKILRSVTPLALAAALLTLIAPAPLVAQATSSVVANRLTQPIDDNARITLKGTVHPLASAANDRGAASDSMPLDRLTLVLKRSDAQETALKQFISDAHTPGSASYHKWLTPDQFGRQFGPSDSDLATVQAWLQSHGFAITKVNAGRQSLEISGNAGQFRDTFHSQIHKYVVNGETHYANSTDPQIPAALAPVVNGFASLNNFRLKSNARVLGQATYNTQTHIAKPQWTYGDSNGVSFVLAPQDYAVQYDLNPLYTAGTNGTGQTIAIVNDSNINVYLVNQFRSIFNLPANPPQVIIDGNDPGIDGINNPDGTNTDSVEAYLDVEWSGAVAPNATIDLVIAADTELQNGLILALQHAIYSNVAPVVSLSFGACESALGSFNTFLSALYEQAAAQGQTVLVSSGDSGSAACDSSSRQYAVKGQQVSGYASTPYNVAVGGTDFFYSDYASGGASVANYWNTATQQSPAQSIKSVIPEQPWNDSQYGLNIIDYYTNSKSTATTIGGGGGGASNCAIVNSSGGCTAGYPKPSWQTGTGVPSDNVRDIPDVSLFAADGLNHTYYPVCAVDGDCQTPSGTNLVQITGLGGTSASAPSFAGIMALVNQKYGPQGQANFVLYPLKAQYPAAFHDVTHGTNSVPCNFSGSSPNCIAVSSPIIIGGVTEGQIGTGTTAQYNAAAGYNLATGLGSVDANALVTNWGNIHFTNASVMLTSPTAGSTFKHSDPVTFTASVSGTSPTGQVSLMTNSTEDNTQGIANATLNGSGTATATTTLLPGGSYNVWAHYGGDGKNAGGNSQPTNITVTPEPSGVFLNVISPGNGTVASGTTNIPYGTPLVFSAQVAPSSKLAALEACFTGSSACPVYGVPTGVVTFSDGSTKINTAVLNAEGDAEYNTLDQTVAVSATNVGSHSITASYAGDNSYNASSASATTYTIAKAVPEMNAYLSNGSPQQGQALAITIAIDAAGVGGPPTGSVSISGAPSGTPTSAALVPGVDPNTGITVGQALVTIPATASAGTYNVTISYGGDSNYSAAPPARGSIQIGGASSLKPSTTTITPNMSSTSPKSLLSLTVTVTGQGSVAPTGNVDFQISGFDFGTFNLNPVSGTDTSTVTIAGNSTQFLRGANLIVFVYSGDGTYASSTATTTASNLLSDFTMVPQSTIIPIPSSATTGSQTINLTSSNSFSGVVNLTCAGTGGVGCTFDNAAPTLTAGGNAAVKLTVDSNNVSAPGTYNVMVTGQDSTGTYIHTLALQAVVAAASILPKGLTLAGPSSLTIINPGDNATGTLSVSAQGGLTGQVTYSCSVETGPPGFSCSAPNSTITSANATSTLTVSTTSSAAPGNYTADVTATVGSTTSSILKVPIVLNPNAGFGLAGTNIASLAPGATTGNASTITVTPAGGFTGTVNLKCSLTSSPSGAANVPTCSIASTVSVTGTGPVTTPMTIGSTAATSGALARPLDKFFAVGGGITVAGLLLFGIPARRRSWRAILGVLIFAAIVGMSIGCGSSGSGNSGGNSGTTAGTYTFTVNGSDAATGKITESAQVNVTFN